MEHFDPEQYLALVEEHRITFSQVVPDDVHPHAQAARRRCAPATTCRRSSVVVHAAAPCPAEVKAQIIDWFGPIIHEYYAGTEGNGFVYCNSEDWLAHRGTVGKAILGIVHIVGDDGEEVPTGESGTVYFEGELPRPSSTTTTPRRRRARATRRAAGGARSATSATSTTTASSTSPTARRT